jgi:hypothetical protein
LRVTCSTEAATSEIDEFRLSVEATTDSAWLAVSLSDADISFKPLKALSSERICASAPAETSSVISTMRDTAPVIWIASSFTSP